MNYCQNCGHKSHCGEKCLQNYGESEKTVCCNHCRCELDDKKTENINEQKHIKISNNYLVKRDKKNKKKKKNDINLYLENYKKNKQRDKNNRKMMVNKELKSKNEVKKDVTFFSDDDY